MTLDDSIRHLSHESILANTKICTIQIQSQKIERQFVGRISVKFLDNRDIVGFYDCTLSTLRTKYVLSK